MNPSTASSSESFLPREAAPVCQGVVEPVATIVRMADFVQSPSLQPKSPGAGAAYEMKFLLTEEEAKEVEARLRGRLCLDPHANPALGNAYRVTTLYCDTPRFEVYHRLGRHARHKHRLRRYGAEPWVFLERKTKRGQKVRKRRALVHQDELELLAASQTSPDWLGHWHHEQLTRRELRPTLTVEYLRQAYVGACEEGPLRLTFDRAVRGAAFSDWRVTSPHDSHAILSDRVICEFKFRGALPTLFKAVVASMRLSPSGVSKYRLGLQASGLAPPPNRSAEHA